jgi:hypothetical protein
MVPLQKNHEETAKNGKENMEDENNEQDSLA